VTALQVDARARELRHEMGPVAWFVLEELALEAVQDGATLIVPTSVRELAATVSLNKDTVARALSVLVRLGFVERHQPAAGGRFGAGRYALTLPDGVALAHDDTSPPRSHRPSRAPATTHERPHEQAQLTLLDLDADDRRSALDRRRPAAPQPPDALAPRVLRRPATGSREGNVIAGTALPGGRQSSETGSRPC